MKLARKFGTHQGGATAIEYALIAAIIAVGIILAAQPLGPKIALFYSQAGEDIAAATAH